MVSIVDEILYNWHQFGVLQKNLTAEAQEQIRKIRVFTFALANFLGYTARWLFCYRYWQISGVVSRLKRQKMLCNEHLMRLTSFFMIILILANQGLYIGLNFKVKQPNLIAQVIMPFAISSIETVFLLVAAFRIWYALRQAQINSWNEKYMCLNAFVLILYAISALFAHLMVYNRGKEILWVWTLYVVIALVTDLMMAVILWQGSWHRDRHQGTTSVSEKIGFEFDQEMEISASTHMSS